MILQALRQALWDSPKRRNRSCLFVCNIVYGLVAVMFGTCSMIIIAQRELCEPAALPTSCRLQPTLPCLTQAPPFLVQRTSPSDCS